MVVVGSRGTVGGEGYVFSADTRPPVHEKRGEGVSIVFLVNNITTYTSSIFAIVRCCCVYEYHIR